MDVSVSRASNRAKQRILSAPTCTDDFGDAIYRCRYTGAPVRPDDARFVGSFSASVSGVYVAGNDSKAAEKRERVAFDAMDANCNTCAKFRRIPHDRDAAGFVKGRCAQGAESPLMYRRDGETYWVHPVDAMLMDCYVARQA